MGRKAEITKKNPVRETIGAIVIALVLALFIRTFVIQAYKIPSSSMEPTLLIGDHILVSKLSYGFEIPVPAMVSLFGLKVPFFEPHLKPVWSVPSRGDVIVFRYPGDRTKDFIKRVIGIAGDLIEIKDKKIYINGRQTDGRHGVYRDTTLYPADVTVRDNFGPFRVPVGSVFVMGDNRDHSFDSRFWGTVKLSEIKGRAKIIYWSWNRDIHRPRLKRTAMVIR